MQVNQRELGISNVSDLFKILHQAKEDITDIIAQNDQNDCTKLHNIYIYIEKARFVIPKLTTRLTIRTIIVLVKFIHYYSIVYKNIKQSLHIFGLQ